MNIQPAVRRITGEIPKLRPIIERQYLRKEKEKEKEKENPSAALEKLAFIALKMACERMGIKY